MGMLIMGLAQEIQKRIKAKEAEIARIESEMRDLEVQRAWGKAYIQGLRDILPKVTRDDMAPSESDFRPGSAPAKVKALLEQVGKPLHIGEIVQGVGKENTKQNRLSLVGSLARYVREGVVFTRPAPNTFGLLDMRKEHTEEELPESFGK